MIDPELKLLIRELAEWPLHELDEVPRSEIRLKPLLKDVNDLIERARLVDQLLLRRAGYGR